MSSTTVEEEAPRPGGRSHGAYGVYLLLAALLLFHVVNNLYWAAADNRLIRVDEAYHIEKAAQFRVLFSGENPLGLGEKIAAFMGYKMPYPPLAHLTGAAFAGVLGYTPDHVALSSTLALVLMILGVYAVSRQFLGRGPSLYAAFVASFIPLIFGLSRLFSLDFFSVPIVVWGIYALLRTDHFTRTRWVVVFGLLNGLGFLAKQTTFAFLLCPAMVVFLAGVWPAWRGRAAGARVWPAVLPFVRQGMLAVLISVLTFGWWYVPQAGAMYRWWSTHSMNGQGILVGGVDKLLAPLLDQEVAAVETVVGPAVEKADDVEQPEALPEGDAESVGGQAPVAATAMAAPSLPPVPVAPPVTAPRAPHRVTLRGLLSPFLDRWDAYIIYAINDVLFLPTFVLGLLGLVALRERRYRTLKAVMPWVWVLGAYLVMTWLFASKTPRYLAPVAPAFGILCTLALYQIRWQAIRWTAMAAFAGLLVFQYGNLTWHSYGAYARMEIPVFQENAAVKWCVNNGLTLYKDLIVTGVYVIRGPVRGENSADRILSAMARYERQFPPDGNGTSKYRVVSRRSAQPGMSLAERHYGPAGNPMRPVNGGASYESPRYLSQILPEARTPVQAIGAMAETNYLVLKPGDDAEVDRRLMQWVGEMKAYGFQSIDHFYDPGYGKYWSSWYHVMARRRPATLETAVDLFDLCELQSYPPGSSFAVPADRAAELEKRIYRARVAYRGKEVPYSEELNLLTIQVVPTVPGWYQLRFAFEVLKDLRNDYRVYVHAGVTDGHLELVPERFRKGRIVQWNFTPYPPTSTWKAGQIIALRRDVMGPAIPYYLAFGMTDTLGNLYGNRVTAGWVDFSQVAAGAAPAGDAAATP